MQNNSIEIIKDISKCKLLWNQFSPKNTLWEEWETVCSYYDGKNQDPYFIVINEDNKKQGILPLWKDHKESKYYFFGGGYPENMKFWFNLEYFPLVFDNLPLPIKLFDLNKKMVESLIKKFPKYSIYFEQKDHNYHLNLKKYNHDFEEYLKIFNKKHRKNYIYDLKKIKELNYETTWETTEHFEELSLFNLERFGEESDFIDLDFKEGMLKLFNKLKEKNILFTSIIKINNKIEGIESATFYKGVYYVLNGGRNKEIKNLGKLLIKEHILKAIELKADKIDFLAGDTGWKQLWNFDKEEYYEFKKE